MSLLAAGTMAGALMVSSEASARTDVFVHGFNPTNANQPAYWNIGTTGDGVYGFSGNGAETAYNYDYDSTRSWSDVSDNTAPVCALTNAMNLAPGTDMALIAHSAGGNVVSYMLAAAQNGWATSCTVTPRTAKAWATYVVTSASPFRGTEMADSIYGHGGGGFFQSACQTLGAGVASLVINSANSMTWSLQTSFCNTNFTSLTSYGTYGSIYENGGTGVGGDDGTALQAAGYCANLEGAGVFSTNGSDGVVSANSAAGCARGTTVGTQCMPNGHRSWFDGVSHSSNRRNTYNSFATQVWNNNPY